MESTVTPQRNFLTALVCTNYGKTAFNERDSIGIRPEDLDG